MPRRRRREAAASEKKKCTVRPGNAPWTVGDMAVLEGLEGHAVLNGKEVILARHIAATSRWEVVQACDLPQRCFIPAAWQVREKHLQRLVIPVQQVQVMAEEGDPGSRTHMLKMAIQLYLFQPSAQPLLAHGTALSYMQHGVRKGHLDSHYLLAFSVFCGTVSSGHNELARNFRQHVSDEEALGMLRVAAKRGHESSVWLLRQVCHERGLHEEALHLYAKVRSMTRTPPKNMLDNTRHSEIIAEESFISVAHVVQCLCAASLDHHESGQRDKARHALGRAETELLKVTGDEELLKTLAKCPAGPKIRLKPLDLVAKLADHVAFLRNMYGDNCDTGDDLNPDVYDSNTETQFDDSSPDGTASEGESVGSEGETHNENMDSFEEWIRPMMTQIASEGNAMMTQLEKAAQARSSITASLQQAREREDVDRALQRLRHAITHVVGSGPFAQAEFESSVKYAEATVGRHKEPSVAYGESREHQDLHTALDAELCVARRRLSSIRAAATAHSPATLRPSVHRPAVDAVPQPPVHADAHAQEDSVQPSGVEETECRGLSKSERQRIRRQHVAAKKHEKAIESQAAERSRLLRLHPGIMARAHAADDSCNAVSHQRLSPRGDEGDDLHVAVLEPSKDTVETPSSSCRPRRCENRRRQNKLTLQLSAFHQVIGFQGSPAPGQDEEVREHSAFA